MKTTHVFQTRVYTHPDLGSQTLVMAEHEVCFWPRIL